MSDPLDLIRADIPSIDGCPALTRLRAFIVPEGVSATVEHTFRDRDGEVVDLSTDESDSESADASDEVKLRVKELTGTVDHSTVDLYEVTGTIQDAVGGVVRASVPSQIYGHSGIYQLSWGFYRDDELKLVNEGLLSVERTLFGTATQPSHYTDGPPTINELRMQIVDSSGAENLLLDDVEFSDSQIVTAIVKPVQYWNEIPPPLPTVYTTKDFPFKSHWLDAAAGYLMEFASHNYRRNRLNTNAGGVTIDDKNKEQEYLRASKILLDRWREFVTRKKIEINMADVVGEIGSTYGNLYW